VQSLPGHRTPDERRGDSAPPEAIEHWLDRVAERVATAERLTDAQSLPDATVAVREAGGLDEVERLVETLERDGAALEAVRRRSERLADRCTSTDVPLSTFERLT
jgi:hypothetical protein